MGLLVGTKNRDLWEGTTPEVRDSRTSRHSAHEQSQVWKTRLAETTSKRILCACLENRTRGPFLEAPGNYRARKTVLFFIPDGSCKSFENYSIKILAKETKLRWRSEHTLLFLRLWLQNMISGPLSYRDFRETGPWPEVAILGANKKSMASEDKNAYPRGMFGKYEKNV